MQTTPRQRSAVVAALLAVLTTVGIATVVIERPAADTPGGLAPAAAETTQAAADPEAPEAAESDQPAAEKQLPGGVDTIFGDDRFLVRSLIDLARHLGELVGDDDRGFAAGVSAYRAAGGSPGVTAGFARLLDRTGVVCAAAVWLLRLLVERRVYPDPAAVAARIDRLTARISVRPSLFTSGHDPG